MANISKLLAERKGYTKLLAELSDYISGSELNSLLLELFRTRSVKVAPSELVKQFEKNRFVHPSAVDTIDFKELELRCLKLAKDRGFVPITLSPLTVFGACSAVGFVDQNNIMTALRGTEVVADATNVLALLIARDFKLQKKRSVIKYACTHRHVRTQAFSNPAFTAHFSIFCMATGGIDEGNFSFELVQLLEHISAHLSIFSSEFGDEKFTLKIYLKQKNEIFRQRLNDHLQKISSAVNLKIEEQNNPGAYYERVQFKFFLEHHGNEVNLSDGGFVDWTQKLIPNKKQRLIVSGIGTELIYKTKQNSFGNKSM